MGWERRGRHRYFFWRKKVRGKESRTFVGRGPEAELAAALEQMRREQSEQQRRRRRAEQARWEAADEALARVVAVTKLLVRAALRGGGYHQHQRGEWRKRRNGKEQAVTKQQTPVEQLTAEEQERLHTLLEKAQQGDRSVVDALKVALDQHPAIWHRCGDLAAQALSAWVNLTAGENQLVKESLQRKVEAMHLEIGGAAPSPLEKLLVERIVISWVQVGQADAAVAQARSSNLEVHRVLVQRQGCAQRRLLEGVRQLANLRKLLRPALSPWDLAQGTLEETTVSVPFPRAARGPKAAVAN
jgi:hypothetical protein